MRKNKLFRFVLTVFMMAVFFGSFLLAFGAGEPAEEKPAKKYVVGFASLSRTQDWVLMVEDGIKKEAENAGYELFAVDNDFSDSKAISNADAMVARQRHTSIFRESHMTTLLLVIMNICGGGISRGQSSRIWGTGFMSL